MMNFFYGTQFYENAAAERYIGNREGSVETQKDENRMKARLQNFILIFCYLIRIPQVWKLKQ